MKILITGATGFVGMPILLKILDSDKTSVIYAVTRGMKNDFLTHEKLHWVETDIADNHKTKMMLDEFKPDVLIHLAWSDIPNFSEQKCLKNLNQSIDFIDLVLNNSECKKILVAGSCFEYSNKNENTITPIII